MAWFKRVGLFLVVNFLVIITISLVVQLLGLEPFLSNYGVNYPALMVFCLIWGMGGAFISLALSKYMAKWLMGVHVIAPDTTDPEARELVELVHSLAKKAGLPAMPEVGVYASPEVNAFATGATKSRALVAVSSGLVRRMRKEAVEGVLGHEVSHIANGDMVTMTLLQGVVNAFVMFFARVLASVVMRSMARGRENQQGSPIVYYLLVTVFEIIFMLLGSIVIAWYSRFREFRADAGGARLAGRDKMIFALQSLQQCLEVKDPAHQQPAFQAFKISSSGTLLHLFATHPPLELRIARLQSGQ